MTYHPRNLRIAQITNEASANIPHYIDEESWYFDNNNPPPIIKDRNNQVFLKFANDTILPEIENAIREVLIKKFSLHFKEFTLFANDLQFSCESYIQNLLLDQGYCVIKLEPRMNFNKIQEKNFETKKEELKKCTHEKLTYFLNQAQMKGKELFKEGLPDFFAYKNPDDFFFLEVKWWEGGLTGTQVTWHNEMEFPVKVIIFTYKPIPKGESYHTVIGKSWGSWSTKK
jgi:hypothetical protein